MPEIYPKITRANLKRSARMTSEGKGRAPLPGVKTDAKHANAVDKCGHEANRELAKLIEMAMHSVKKGDKRGQHFVSVHSTIRTKTTPVGKAGMCIPAGAGVAAVLDSKMFHTNKIGDQSNRHRVPH